MPVMPVQSTPGCLVTIAPSVSGGPVALIPLPRPQPGTVVFADPPPAGSLIPQAATASASQQRRIAGACPGLRASTTVISLPSWPNVPSQRPNETGQCSAATAPALATASEV